MDEKRTQSQPRAGSPIAAGTANPASAPLYHHRLGFTRLDTTSSGTSTTTTATYDPYRTPTSPGYTGHHHPETGLYYLRTRHYDPTTGQLLTRDPMASLTREPYGYVGGRVLNAADPSGRCALGTWIKDKLSPGFANECGRQDAAHRESTSTAVLNGVYNAGVTLGTPVAGTEEYCTTTWTGGLTCVGVVASVIAMGAGIGAVAGAGTAGLARNASLVATGSQGILTGIACRDARDRDCAWGAAMTAMGAISIGIGSGAGKLGANAARSKYLQGYMLDSWNFWLGLPGVNPLPRFGTVGGSVNWKGDC